MQNTNCQFLTPTSTNIGGYRYFFNGQEVDIEVFGEVSNFGYEFRQYDSRLGRWWSVDPKWNEYPGVSPYVFCNGSPVMLVDSKGEEANPIYDTKGWFLGTDDLGIQGDAIIMDRANFKQNMNHDEALRFATDFDALGSNEAFFRYSTQYSTINSRPDWDGYLTLQEANNWYRNGNGQPLFVDLNKIDLSGFYSLGESAVGKTYRFNLAVTSGSVNDRLVYGNLTFVRMPHDGVRAYADKYDFDMKSWWNPFNWMRNVETLIGQQVAGEGQPYLIYLYGTATLKSSPFEH